MWQDVARMNREKTRSVLECLKQTAAVLEQCCETETAWLNTAETYGVQSSMCDYSELMCVIKHVLSYKMDRRHRPDNLVQGKVTQQEKETQQEKVMQQGNNDMRRPKDNGTTAQEKVMQQGNNDTLQKIYGSSDDLIDFMSHITAAKDMPNATDIKTAIDKMTDAEIATALEKIPDPQDEVDRVMNERRFQSMVADDQVVVSRHPVKFITDVDGQQSATQEPPPANILSSLKREEYENLMVQIYNAAKDMVEKMVDKTKMTTEQIEQMTFKQADKMLAAYIEKNKRPSGY